MVVEIRIYKRYDMDLFSLFDAGLPITSMMRDAIIAYANSSPIHFLIDEAIPFDLNDKTTLHTRINIPNSEKKAIYMLTHIKHGLRNNFCKMLLRNALIQQNLCGYFSDENLLQLHNNNLEAYDLTNLDNVIPCSKLRTSRTISFAGKTITIEPTKKAQVNNNPFVNMNDTNSIVTHKKKEKKVAIEKDSVFVHNNIEPMKSNYLEDNNEDNFVVNNEDIMVAPTLDITNNENVKDTDDMSIDDFLSAFDSL